MKQSILLFACLVMAVAVRAQRTIVVKAGDARSLLEAIGQANETNASPDSKRTFILIPDGLYDLGETVLTQITGHNIALVGQSTEGTVIRNKPDFKNEGISKTAVFQNRGTGNYFQDMTLKNDLDYYACGAAGRAVTLHDKGSHTICNRVRMLSFQDTYYSDNELAQNYMKETEIHGTVDFICGAGDVWFEQCRIVTEKRNKDGHGRNVIVAPRTSKTHWGYIFNGCTIENIVSAFDYARGWHSLPRCTWLHTTLLSPEKLNKTRFDVHGMRTVLSEFNEYGTCDADGRDITPAENVITLTLTQKKTEGNQVIETTQERTVNTTITPAEAARYTTDNVFGDWHPDCLTKRIERQARRLMKRL